MRQSQLIDQQNNELLQTATDLKANSWTNYKKLKRCRHSLAVIALKTANTIACRVTI